MDIARGTGTAFGPTVETVSNVGTPLADETAHIAELAAQVRAENITAAQAKVDRLTEHLAGAKAELARLKGKES